MNTDLTSSSAENAPAALDKKILGSYVEYELKNPCIPNGVYADTIKSAIPVVVPLTYKRMVDEILYGCALVMEHDVLESFKACVETDPRLKHLQLTVDKWDQDSKWVSLEEKAA